MGCCLSRSDSAAVPREEDDTLPLCEETTGSSVCSESEASSTRAASPPSPGTPLLGSDSSDSGYYTPEEIVSV